MDLNGDGRIGGGYGHAPAYNHYGPPGYPPQYHQYGGAPCPPNYGPYGAPPYNHYGGAPCPPPHYNQYGAPGYGPAPYHHHGGGGAGGGLVNQLERITNMDLNGDGRIGGGYGHAAPYNPYGRPY